MDAIDSWSGKWGYSYRLLSKDGLRQKKILDCGCGTGFHTVYFAKKGAHVCAIDINPDATNLTTRRAKVNGVAERIDAMVMALESLSFPDSYFDLVFGGMILHHVDVARASREIARVLKKEGRAIFVETSARNIFIMLARKYLTGRFGIPKYASPEERPLTLSDIKEIRKNFTSFYYRKGDGIFSMLDRIFPSKRAVDWFSNIDCALFSTFPSLEKYSYYVVLEFIK